MKRIIRNIGVLDLRNTREEDIEDIERVENVGLVLYSPDTAHLMSRLSFVNLGASIETPEDFRMITGQISLGGNEIKGYKEPVNLLITGQVIVKDDLDAKTIDEKIGKLIIAGQVLCPENIAPIFRSKLINMTGQVLTYKAGTKVVIGKLKVDHNMLKSIEKPQSFTVIGKADFTGEFPSKLLDEKLEELRVIGLISAREEYMEVLYKKIQDTSMAKIRTIPRGYILIEKDLTLDEVTIRKFGGDKLYVNGEILVKPGVTPEMLKEYVGGIKIGKRVICPENLKGAILDLSVEPSPEILTYTGKLIVVDMDHILTPAELEFAPEKLTYIIKGSMEIEEQVDPNMMVAKIENIDNLGEIRARTKQYGVLNLVLRTNKGEITRIGKESEYREVSNIGSLKL